MFRAEVGIPARPASQQAVAQRLIRIASGVMVNLEHALQILVSEITALLLQMLMPALPPAAIQLFNRLH